MENKTMKGEEEKDSKTSAAASGMTPSKKFLKTKSRIFNFFR
jgi:hypothetical protein